jgi:endogenous inhibitor of DNA gyrase (YacG/DUF329 family)
MQSLDTPSYRSRVARRITTAIGYRPEGRQADNRHNICYYMPCRIRCNECDLDRWLEDCVTAHKQAKEHEARYTDHWITLHNLPDYDSDSSGE